MNELCNRAGSISWQKSYARNTQDWHVTGERRNGTDERNFQADWTGPMFDPGIAETKGRASGNVKHPAIVPDDEGTNASNGKVSEQRSEKGHRFPQWCGCDGSTSSKPGE